MPVMMAHAQRGRFSKVIISSMIVSGESRGPVVNGLYLYCFGSLTFSAHFLCLFVTSMIKLKTIVSVNVEYDYFSVGGIMSSF